MQCYPQQTASADDLVLWSILIEVFQARESLGSLLHFVKNQQCIGRINFVSSIELKAHYQPLYLQAAQKQIPHTFIVVKIDINYLIVFLSTKFPHEPGLSNLTGSADDKRLSPIVCFPLLKLLHSRSIHVHHPA